MSTIKLHAGVIEIIDKAQKQCLWRGIDEHKRNGNLVAWDLVQKAKNKGGLGVINLKIQNEGLLVKQLHKFYSRAEVPWVQLIWESYYDNCVPRASRPVGSFWWKDVLSFHSSYREEASCKIGNGSSVLFWQDSWLGGILQDKFPALADFASDIHASVKDIQEPNDLAAIYLLPLSAQAYIELQELESLLNESQFNIHEADEWSFPGAANQFSVSRYYKHKHDHIQDQYKRHVAPKTFVSLARQELC
ncbi:hypothetical protein U9M48_039444, partial [Paspalum notatum var. saurae]